MSRRILCAIAGALAVLPSLRAAPPEPTDTPIQRTVDLNVGEAQEVELSNGKKVRVKLLDVDESRDELRKAVRGAQVKVEVGDQTVTLACANYHLPVTIARVQIDCPITRGYRRDSLNGVGGEDPWGIENVLSPTLVAFRAARCRIVIRSAGVAYTGNLVNAATSHLAQG